jgi:hypothetical protein
MVETASQPVDIVRGKPWKLPVQWRDPNGVGIDLTGFTIDGDLRSPGSPSIKMTVANGGVVVSSMMEGRFEFRIAESSVTDQVPEGALSILAIEIIDGGGFVVAGGRVPIRGVTL